MAACKLKFPTKVKYLTCDDCGYSSPEDTWACGDCNECPNEFVKCAPPYHEQIICPVCDAVYEY